MVSDLLDKLDGTEERTLQEKAIKECAATAYIGMYVFPFSRVKTLLTIMVYFLIVAGYDSVSGILQEILVMQA